jgi:hypothetical protein
VTNYTVADIMAAELGTSERRTVVEVLEGSRAAITDGCAR